jgi:hypothetical protein
MMFVLICYKFFVNVIHATCNFLSLKKIKLLEFVFHFPFVKIYRSTDKRILIYMKFTGAGVDVGTQSIFPVLSSAVVQAGAEVTVTNVSILLLTNWI